MNKPREGFSQSDDSMGPQQSRGTGGNMDSAAPNDTSGANTDGACRGNNAPVGGDAPGLSWGAPSGSQFSYGGDQAAGSEPSERI